MLVGHLQRRLVDAVDIYGHRRFVEEYPAAVDSFTKLLTDQPQHPLASDAYRGRGMARRQAGQFAEALADFDAVTAASTTVSSTVQMTAPCAWRAISPVSSVTCCVPRVKVFLIGFKGIPQVWDANKKRSSVR